MGRTKRRRGRKTLRDHVVIESEPTFVNLKQWMKSSWKSDCPLKLADFKHSGRGLLCTKRIKENTVLLQIPCDLMITGNTIVKNTEFLTVIHPDCKLQFQEILALFLVHEKHKKDHSTWKFYLNSLPRETPPLPVFSTASEINLLPHEIKIIVETLKTKLEKTWYRLQKAINPTWTCRCCEKSAANLFTFDSFVWGYTVVNTRAVYIDPKIIAEDLKRFLSDKPCMALCPYLDMLNHGCEAQTSTELVRVYGRWMYRLVTLSAHERYQQVFISYGAHDNEKLLCEYGFFVPGNLLDCVKFTLEDVLGVLRRKLSAKQRVFICPRNLIEDLYVSCLGMSFNLKAVLYVLLQPNAFEWAQDVFSDTYPAEYFERMCCVSRSLLTIKSKAYGETLRHTKSEFNSYTTSFQNVIKYVGYLKGLCESFLTLPYT